MDKEKRQLIKLTKIDTVKDPRFATATWEEYEPGTLNPKSPPVEYTVKGYLINKPEVGQSLGIARIERNGIEVDGVMQTSNITELKDNRIYTLNSVYLLEDADD